jgi:hypothetical protein
MKQTGDFVDFRTLNVFGNNFRSSGWGSAFYVNGGVDMHWIQHAYLSFDARYLWADATLDQPWRSFDPLDLTGLRVTGGISAFF